MKKILMEKKTYQKPEMTVVMLASKCQLLDATHEQGAPRFEWDDNEVG